MQENRRLHTDKHREIVHQNAIAQVASCKGSHAEAIYNIECAVAILREIGDGFPGRDTFLVLFEDTLVLLRRQYDTIRGL